MRLLIDPERPDPRKIQRAAEALEAGEVIAYPTDTVYGLGCDLFNKKAIDRLYEIKGMPRTQQLAFICPDLGDIARYAIVEKPTYRILRHCLPGPYCFLLQATREVPRLVQSKRKTVGIRIPHNDVILSLARQLGRPIVSTTANRDGGEPFVDPEEIDDRFPGLSLILDAGGGGLLPTTVVDLSGPSPVIVREGAGATDFFLDENGLGTEGPLEPSRKGLPGQRRLLPSQELSPKTKRAARFPRTGLLRRSGPRGSRGWASSMPCPGMP